MHCGDAMLFKYKKSFASLSFDVSFGSKQYFFLIGILFCFTLAFCFPNTQSALRIFRDLKQIDERCDVAACSLARGY